MRILRSAHLALVGLVISAPVHAATLTRLAPVLGDGRASEVAVEGNLAAVAAETFMLMLDVTQPSAPLFLSATPQTGRAATLALAGGHVYLASYDGLRVYDVSTPTQPVLVRTLPQIPERIVEDGGWLYVATSGALQIYDLAVPGDPQLLGAYTNPSLLMRDFAFVGGLFYISADRLLGGYTTPELIIVDFTNPATPILRDTWIPPMLTLSAMSVAAKGSTIYVDLGTDIRLLSYTFPLPITELGTVACGSNIVDLDADGSLLTVGTSTAIRTYRIQVPTSPVFRAELPLPGTGGQGTVVLGTLYRGSGASGVHVINVSDPMAPSVLAQFNRPTSLRQVTREGSTVYGLDDQLWVFDIMNPAAPIITDQLNYDAFGSCRLGNRIFLGCTAGIVVLDITIPTHPTPLATVSTAGYPLDVAVINGQLVASLSGVGLAIYSLANPDLPALSATLPLAIQSRGRLAGLGAIAYVAQSGVPGSLAVVDVATPGAPALLTTLPGDNYSGAPHVSSGRLYVFGDPIKIYDLANPASPQPIGTIQNQPFGSDLAVEGNRVYFGSSQPPRLEAFDAIDASNPVPLATLPITDFWDQPRGLDAQGDLIVAALSSGFGIYRLDGAISATPDPAVSTTGLRLRATPAPFRASVRIELAGLPPAGAEPARLVVFDAAGRFVREWRVQSSGAEIALTWDGRDAAGRDLPAGSYFLRLSAGTVSASIRVLRLR